jgi:putative MFS transporter
VKPASPESAASIYWTAFIGLFFDYYDLYLFVYLERTLAQHFALDASASGWLQFCGLAGVGVGALAFGYLADRFGRGRMMLATFAVYFVGIAGLSLAWNVGSLLVFRLLASVALGAEWGISHAYLAERVSGERRYRFSALLQFSILGGLLAALAARFALPVVGWRWLFAASLAPVVVLSIWRWRALRGDERARFAPVALAPALAAHARPFLFCLLIASLTIASGTMNVFFAKDLPQSTLYTVLFWGNVAPGMLLGAWIVRRLGVRGALGVYAAGLTLLSAGCWLSGSAQRNLAFAVVLPLLNGIPFGLMGAYFNEVFGAYRTLLSGAAYNLGRILAGFSPVLLIALNLHLDGRYLVFTAALGLGVAVLAWAAPRPAASGAR